MRPKVRIWVIINVGSYLVIKARNEVRNLIRNGVRVTLGPQVLVTLAAVGLQGRELLGKTPNSHPKGSALAQQPLLEAPSRDSA